MTSAHIRLRLKPGYALRAYVYRARGHRGSRPRAATPAGQARAARRVQQKPPDGSTHWYCRKLAADMGLSYATVHRILAQAKLQPHRLERLKRSTSAR